jgi:hypothetical protein
VAFDEQLAERVRKLLSGERSLEEKRMFGGLAFMINGHMCCGIVNRDLVLRVGRDEYKELLSRPHARQMDFTGRSMGGFLYVSPAGVRSARELRAWIGQSLRFIAFLPPK